MWKPGHWKLVRLAVVCASVLVAVHGTYAAATESHGQPENRRDGKALYVQKGCHHCHGYEGQGWAAAKRIAQPALPYAAFRALVRKPNGSMPPYSEKVLSEVELTKVHGYLESLRSPDVSDIELLQPD